MMRWTLVAALMAVMVGFATGSAAPPKESQQLTLSMQDALSYYAIGERDVIARALQAAGGGALEQFMPEFKKSAAAWMTLDGPAELPRRRLIAVTFALETADAGIDIQFEMTRQMAEWACETMRASGPPTEEERQVLLAVLALIESSFDARRPGSNLNGDLLLVHVGHIKSRFPKEPRIDLAEALVQEYEYWQLRARPGGSGTYYDEAVGLRAMPSLQRAAAHEDTLREAGLRLGYFEYVNGHIEKALENFDIASRGDDDPTRTYVAFLLQGRTYEKTGRFPDAIASFRQALQAVNGLSAALALAVRLYDVNERDEADRIVESALSDGAQARDPWKQYGYGDFRRWPSILATLRAQLP